MAEWSKAPVLKTGEVQASKGSNPFPSASNSSNELLGSNGCPKTFVKLMTSKKETSSQKRILPFR